MSVVLLNEELNAVEMVFEDVETVQDAVDKYGLDEARLVDGSHAPGTLYDGTEFTAPDPSPAPVPEIITKLQLKRALTATGQWAAVKAGIEADPDMLEDWTLAVELQRSDPIIATFAASNGLDEAALDALFTAAAAT
ncbi:MAG: hypothetical protein AAF409_20430 [Pseudomonadota bacterium]